MRIPQLATSLVCKLFLPQKNKTIDFKWIIVAQIAHVFACLLFTSTPLAIVGLYALNAVCLLAYNQTKIPIFAIASICLGVWNFKLMTEYRFSLLPLVEF